MPYTPLDFTKNGCKSQEWPYWEEPPTPHVTKLYWWFFQNNFFGEFLIEISSFYYLSYYILPIWIRIIKFTPLHMPLLFITLKKGKNGAKLLEHYAINIHLKFSVKLLVFILQTFLKKYCRKSCELCLVIPKKV